MKSNKKPTTHTEGIVVSDARPNLFKRGLNFVSRSKLRKIVFGLIAVVILAGIGWALYKHFHKPKPPAPDITVPTIVNVCTASDEKGIIEQVTPLFRKAQNQQLKLCVDKMMTLKGYEKNPNYLYISLVYFINVGDISSAQKTLKLLSPIYNSSPPSKSLTMWYGNLATLKKLLTSAQANIEKARNNFQGVGSSNSGGTQ